MTFADSSETHLTAAYSYNKVYLVILECYQV